MVWVGGRFRRRIRGGGGFRWTHEVRRWLWGGVGVATAAGSWAEEEIAMVMMAFV